MKKTMIIMIVGLAATLFATGSIAAENMGVDIHGFISQGYLSGDEADFTGGAGDDAFVFNEMGINFGKELTENLRFGIQLFARDFAETSDNEVKIDWAFADYRFSELLGMRFGQIKFPHGFYNEARDIDMLRNPIFLPESVYQEVSHDLYVNDIFLSLQGISSRDLFLSLQGVGLYGYLDLSMFGGLTYQAMFGTQSIDTNSNISSRQLSYIAGRDEDFEISEISLENNMIDVEYKYAGNVLWDTPIDGLRFGASLNNIKMSVSSRVNEAINYQEEGMAAPVLIAEEGELATVDYKKLLNTVFSVEYTWENLILTAEYINTVKEYKLDAFVAARDLAEMDDMFPTLNLENFATFGKAEKTKNATGWYAGGAYRLTDWLEGGGYYSRIEYDGPDSAIDFPIFFFKELDEICATLRFDINEYWAVKLEAHRFSGVYPTLKYFDQSIEDVEEEWNLYVAKMTVAF